MSPRQEWLMEIIEDHYYHMSCKTEPCPSCRELHDKILDHIRGMVPEKEVNEYNPTLTQWDKGYNFCREEMLKRLNG